MNEKIRFLVQSMRCRESFKFAKVLLVLLLMASAIQAQPNDKPETFTLKFTNTAIIDVLKNIEKNSDYVFLYSSSLKSALQEKVSLNVKNASIRELMNRVLGGTALRYRIDQRQITITRTERAQPTQQHPTLKVTGVVTDENGDPAVGATIKEKGTINGTVTDAQGTFSLNVPGDAILTITYVGYQEKEIRLKGRTLIAISMIPDNKVLDEVVVVGFGKQKKESLVGAVQAVKPEDLKITSSNLSTSFAGNVPGIITRQTTGEPGYDNAEFYIRGVSTFGSNKSPLIILDGVEISTEMLNNIPPESIESFSVLKDATATSLYGSRGANGVIIVNTKHGTLSEKMKIDVRLDNTFSSPTKIQDMANGLTFMQMYNEAIYNEAKFTGQDYVPYYSNDKIENTRKKANPYLFPNNDWYSKLFKDVAISQNLNLSIRGGSKLITYFLNAGIFYENGIVRQPTENTALDVTMRSKKYLFQSNVSAHITPTTKIELNMNTQLFYYHAPKENITNLFYYTMRVNPVGFPVTLPTQDGDTFTRYGMNTRQGVGGLQTNPYALLSSGYTERNYVYSTTALNIDQDLKFITPGLKANALASFYNYSYNWLDHWMVPFYYKVADEYQNGENGDYIYDTESIGAPGQPYLQSNSGRDPTQTVWSLQAKLDYAHTFGKHNIGAALVYHMKEIKKVKDSGNEYDLLPYREQGLAGRLTYDYAQRYLMEATFGYNGSENFKRGNRFGFFPALALGWTISNESFFRTLKNVIHNFKIRGSYGLVGNDALATRFPYITTIDMSSEGGWWIGDNYSNIRVPWVTTYGNENATWEKSKKFNIGADVNVLGSIDISFDYFTEHRTGIFMQRQSILSTAGYGGNRPFANIGAVKNKGVDMSAVYTKVYSKDFTMKFNGSFTYAHNEMTEVDEPKNVETYYSRIGHPINSIRGLVADGLFTSQEEIDKSPRQELGTYTLGDIKYKDLNGDNKIDLNDVTTIGNPEIPEIIYGFGGTVKYKKFDCSFMFQGAGKVSLMMTDIHPFVDKSGDGYGISQYIVDNHWSETNNNARAAYPRLSPTFVNNDVQTSSFYLRNGSYMRLKNAEFGYTPLSWMRIYIAATNIFTISPFKTWDPEMGSGNGLRYPLQRTFKIGVQFHY